MAHRSDRTTRRRFLKTTTACAAAPMFVPGFALGNEQQAAASERITVGIIGVGKMANDYHIPSLAREADAQIVAVCDVDTTRRTHAQRRVDDYYSRQASPRACAAYNDFREIIGRDDIDAVLIATPDHWHTIPIVEACKAGKDVYCEKPLTLTIRGAKLCIDAVRKFKRVLQTGSQQRSSVFGPFRQGVELIRSGRIGDVKSVTVGVGGPSRWCDLPEEEMEPGLDWNLWLGQAPKRPYHSVLSPRGVHNHFPAWRAFREYSGGGHTDMGAHHYDIAQWALDMDTSGPVEIIPPEDEKATSGVKYIYANGVEMTHGGPPGCVFTGTKGTVHLGRGVLKSDPENLATEPLGPDDVQLPRSPGHHRNWLDCIKTRERPVADVEVGARSVTVCHLGNLAYWYRRPLKWGPQQWRFIDDPEANTWLDRDRRDPWQLPALVS